MELQQRDAEVRIQNLGKTQHGHQAASSSSSNRQHIQQQQHLNQHQKGGKKKTKKGQKKSETAVVSPIKYMCRFIVGIRECRHFFVSKRIIGTNGANMKYIADLCPGAKIRLRGRGSGFKEPHTNRESNIPLQLNLSASSSEEYEVGKREVSHLLTNIYAEYKAERNEDVCIKINEHPKNPESDKMP